MTIVWTKSMPLDKCPLKRDYGGLGTVYYVANFVMQGTNEGKVSGAMLMGTTEYRFCKTSGILEYQVSNKNTPQRGVLVVWVWDVDSRGGLSFPGRRTKRYDGEWKHSINRTGCRSWDISTSASLELKATAATTKHEVSIEIQIWCLDITCYEIDLTIQ